MGQWSSFEAQENDFSFDQFAPQDSELKVSSMCFK